MFQDMAEKDIERTDLRQRPEMASLRLLVLKFVSEYITEYDGSPSYGEIAAAMETSRTRIKKSVLSLVGTGHLLRTPGPRGLALPDAHEKAVRELEAMGFTLLSPGVTNPPLLPPPELDYIPEQAAGDDQDDETGQAGRTTAA